MKSLWQQVVEKAETSFERRWWKLIEATKRKSLNDINAQITDLEQRLSALPAFYWTGGAAALEGALSAAKAM